MQLALFPDIVFEDVKPVVCSDRPIVSYSSLTSITLLLVAIFLHLHAINSMKDYRYC
jgi:hypothetical protein